MKNSFHGYYPPSSEEYERLWKEGLIVLDTNVLLNLYRLPTTARDELISVLELLKERLWIPHQVALEFHRRRLTVIASERKTTEDALTSASELVSDLKKKVDALQIDKRGLGIDPQPLITDLDKANLQLIEAIKAAHSSQLDISASDPIRERLDELLDGCVGVGPSSQAELDVLISEGEDRYKDKTPPGFMDTDKDKNPNEATFVFDHIKYQRKFGDLILWRQLINYVKSKDIKTVLLITADRKEDWWWREQGKTIGPQPELIREIHREGAVDLFWMYSSVQFVEHANKYSTANVSTESVAEIKSVAFSGATSWNSLRDYVLHSHQNQFITPSEVDIAQRIYPRNIENSQIEEAVGQWLGRLGDIVDYNVRGFPDFLVRNGEDAHGYEVKYLRQFNQMLMSPGIINSILRGYMETNEGHITAFTLVLVISGDDYYDILLSEKHSELNRRLEKLLRKYPIDSIIVGTVIDDSFEVLTQQKRSDREEGLYLFE